MEDKRMRKFIVITVCSVIIIWLLSLLFCDIMTLIYGESLVQMQNRPTMLSNPEYIKVLKCNCDIAKLYYVEEGMAGGHVLYLEKVDGLWTAYQWDCIWSGRGGSASGVIYPYIWHCIYGGL